MSLNDYLRRQIEAAMSPDNRWHCSRHYGREITDEETLLRYFIKNGGAEHFGNQRRAQPSCGDAYAPPSRQQS